MYRWISRSPDMFLVHAEMLLKIDQRLFPKNWITTETRDWPHAEINVTGLVSVY